MADLQEFLNNEGIEGVAQKFIDVMNGEVATRIRLSYGVAPQPPSIPLVLVDVPVILGVSPTGVLLANGFFAQFSGDIIALIISLLIAGSVSLLSPAATGIPPAAPISSTLSPLVIPFGVSPALPKALLKWAVALLPEIEPRLANIKPEVV